MEYKKLIPFINTESESSSHVIARAEKYIEHGADALFIFRYSSNDIEREEFLSMLKDLVAIIEVPIIAGIYFEHPDDAKKAFNTGVSKIAIQNKKLNDYDAYIKQIEEEKEKALKKVERVTKKLHDVRNRYKTVFADEICIHLKELNFLDTRFEIHLKDAGQFSANGKDEAEFYLALNPGEPVKPLENIASGGELSRIMLAIKTVLADAEDTPTLIFDEIDAGISGVTAAKVGEKLKLIGKSRQVICITHLSQIAAVADSHFLIEKSAENESVKTRIRLLNEEDSVKELARILGGDKITSSIMESAREMKEMAKSEI